MPIQEKINELNYIRGNLLKFKMLAILLFLPFFGLIFSSSYVTWGGVVGVVWFAMVIMDKITYSIYKRKYTEFIPMVLGDKFENLQFSREKEELKTQIVESNLRDYHNKIEISNVLTGSYQGIEFTHADVRLLKLVQKGNDAKSRIAYQGKWLCIKNPTEFKGEIQLHTEPTIKYPYLQPIKFEYINFNKKFKTFATSKLDAFYLFTPQYMEFMDKFADKFTRAYEFDMCYKEGYVYTMMAAHLNDLKPSVFFKLDLDNEIENIQAYFSIVPNFIDDFTANK